MATTNNLLQNRNVMLLNTNIDQEIIKKNVPNDLVEEMFNQVIDLNINERQPAQISPIEDIVAEMKAGRMVILIDESYRDWETDRKSTRLNSSH